MYLVTRGEVGSVRHMHDSWHAACTLDMATVPEVVLGLTNNDKDYLKLLTPVFVLVVLTWGRPGKPQHATNCNHGPWSDWLLNIRQSWHCLSSSESGLHTVQKFEVTLRMSTQRPGTSLHVSSLPAVPKLILQVTNGLTYRPHSTVHSAQGTSVIVQESSCLLVGQVHCAPTHPLSFSEVTSNKIIMRKETTWSRINLLN